MFKFVLVVLLISPDYAGYAEYVSMHDTLAQCEAEKRVYEKDRPVREFPDHHFVAECVKTRPIKSTGA